MTNPADGPFDGKILLVGDTHGDSRFLGESILEAAESGCSALIQLGDFGFVFSNGGYDTRPVGHQALDAISAFAVKAGVTVMFLDGNHENFPLLKTLGADPDATDPTTIAPNIVYLPRGSRFTYGGRDFMAFGGAVSIDKAWRTEGESWWPEELITDAQVAAVGSPPVDVLLSHDVPKLAGGLLHYMLTEGYKLDPTSEDNRAKLHQVYEKVQPYEVFHGHYHRSYETRVDEDWGEVLITGLSCNGERGSTFPLEPRT